MILGFLLLGICASVVEGKDESLLFAVDFDDYSVNAGFSKGDPKCYSFENPDLQLRMFPGIKGKGNALTMNNEESCTYKLPGNFDPRHGSVSMWVSPQNWKVSANNWQHFFSVSTPKFHLILYKYIWSKHLMFYIRDPSLPEGKQIFAAHTILKDEDWEKGKWHKLDITWDAKGMKLYVDGVMPEVYHKNSQLRKPFVKFQNQLDFQAPGAFAGSYMVVGMPKSNQKNEGTDINYQTAYDDIKIYNRPLSAAEIKNAYEKYFPSKLESKLQCSVITIPKTAAGIEVDGVINDSEWSDAGLVPVLKFNDDDLPGLAANAYYKYDDKNIYIGMTANRACRMLKNHKDHDDSLWQEDSFEILLEAPTKNIYHFIINGNGAVYDELDTDKKWDSSALCVAFQGEDYWSAEIAIPLESFGEKVAGEKWRGNFCATYYTDTGKFSGWSKILGSYAKPQSFGVIQFGTDNNAVRVNSIGNVALGALDLSVDVIPLEAASQIKVYAQSEPDGAAIIKFPGQLAGKTWKTTLPIGKQNLQLKGVKGKNKELVFLYDKFIYVNFPLEINYTCWVNRKYIEVAIDLNNSGQDNLQGITGKGLGGTVKLLNSESEACSTRSFTVTNCNMDVELSLPDDLLSGRYSICAEVVGVKGILTRTQPFGIPDMTPYKEKIAVDHSVPYPWKSITTTNDKIFKLLGREYTFSNGAFPVQVVSRGKELLASPVTMLCNGKNIAWSEFKVVERNPDVIKFSGRGAVGEILFQWNSELWFDGLYSLELAMDPETDAGVDFEALKISWEMPEEFAKFVMTPLCEKWENNQIKLMPKPSTITAREHIVWLTGHLRGFMWWPESDANWVNMDAEKPIIVSRSNGLVKVVLNIISKPAKLSKTAIYKMAFMATPAKDQPKGYRKFHADGYGLPAGQTAQHMGWGSFRNEFRDDDTTTPTSHIPRDPITYKKKIQSWRKKGIAPFTYAMPGQIRSKTAEYNYFGRTWATIPSHHHRLSKGGEKYILQRCCGNTQVSDLFAYRTDQLFKQYPDLAGLYYDVGSSAFCQNTEHGHGGVDAFGKQYFSSGALALREMLIRIYKLHKKYDKVFFYHTHSHFNPVCHTFVDYWYPGEQYYRMIAKNFEYAYCEGITLDEYQSELNGKIKGVGIQLLPQYGRAASGIQSIQNMQEETKSSPEWAIRTMTPLLLHDVNVTAAYIDRKVTVPRLWKIQDDNNFSDAEFYGYWTDPGVTSASSQVLISVYSWDVPSPYKKILAVSNMGREEQPLALTINQARLGISGDVEYFELWEKKSMTFSELKTDVIKGNHFMLIGIK